MKTNCLANLNAGACFLQRVAYIFVFKHQQASAIIIPQYMLMTRAPRVATS